MATYIFPHGTATVTVASAEKLAVYNSGVSETQVYQVVGYPNHPNSQDLLGVVSNTQTVFGAFSSGATVVINAGAHGAYYDTGATPNARESVPEISIQGAPTAKTAAATLTIAELLTGYITITHATGSNVNLTLPTGTLSDAGVDLDIDESFDWTVANLSAAAADTATVTAGTGHTVVGVMVVQSAHSTTGGLYGNAARYRTRKTAANTFVTYRLA